MSVSVTKSGFNVREKLKQLQKPIGLKGSELMRAETAQEARDIVSAGRKNLVYNGEFQIAQRNPNTVSGTSNSGYVTVDRWFVYNNAGGSNITHGRDSDVPNQEPCSYSYKYEVTGSAPTSDSNYLMLRQYLEVYDVRHLGFGTSGAKSLTLSFWLKSNHSGTVTWNLMAQNAPQQRQISRQVQIDGSGSWKKYVMTVPGDIGGTGISNAGGNNGQGLYFDLIFWTESGWRNGTRFNDTWQNNVSGERAVGHINMLTKLNDYINITGVQLEVGKNATEFEHRSYGEELALCQRYFQAFNYGSLCWMSPRSPQGVYTEYTYGSMKLKTTMRAAPTIGVIGTSFQGLRYHGSGYSASTRVNPSSNITLEYAGLDCVTPRPTWNFNWTVNDLINFVVSANDGSALTFSAEL